MKVWIIFDSKFSHNKQIADMLGTLLKNGNEVNVKYAKDVSPKEVAKIVPDVLLFGGPLRCGSISFTMKGWMEKFTDLILKKNSRLTKVAVWGTHMKDNPDVQTPEKYLWGSMKLKWKALMDNVPADKHMNDVKDFIVMDIKGPLQSDWQENVKQFALDVQNL